MDANNYTSIYPTTRPSILQPIAYTIILSSLYSILFIMSAVGNSLVVICYILDNKRRMRIPMNILIVNLAICDLCVTFITMPVNFTRNITIRNWLIGRIACHLLHGLPNIFVAASSFTALTISIERYRYVCYPHKRKMTVRWTLWIIALIWLLAILTALPIIASVSYFERNGAQVCYHVFHRDPSVRAALDQVYIVFLTVIVFLIPVCVTGTLYWRVGVFIRERQRRNPSRNSQLFNRINKKVFKMLVIIVSLMFICWIPLYTCFLLISFAPRFIASNLTTFRITYSISHVISYVNGAINPIIYARSHESFRESFARNFLSKRERNSSIEVSQSNYTNHKMTVYQIKAYTDYCYNDQNSQNSGCSV